MHDAFLYPRVTRNRLPRPYLVYRSPWNVVDIILYRSIYPYIYMHVLRRDRNYLAVYFLRQSGVWD